MKKIKDQTAVRTFTVTVLNFGATSCYNIFNLNQLNITVPPLLDVVKDERFYLNFVYAKNDIF